MTLDNKIQAVRTALAAANKANAAQVASAMEDVLKKLTTAKELSLLPGGQAESMRLEMEAETMLDRAW